MRLPDRLVPVIAMAALVVGLAHAADQTILGKQMQVADPKPGVDATRRKFVGQGKEVASSNTIVGDPSSTGAVARVGIFPSNSQFFYLPQGTDPQSGKPFWRATSTGYTYKDKAGTNGAVKIAQIQKSSGGTFQLKVVALAKNGSISLVPPNTAQSAVCLRLDIVGGDHYATLMTTINSTVVRNDAKLFKLTNSTSGETSCFFGGE